MKFAHPNHIEFNETVELFFNETLKNIKEETMIPYINFVFDDSINSLLKDKEINIDYNYNEDAPIIYINDSYKFFSLLTDLLNEYYKMAMEVYYTRHVNFFRIFTSKLFLRMTPNDPNNIEDFLRREIEFASNRDFVKYRYSTIVGKYQDYTVKANIKLNAMEESNQCMTYTLYKDDTTYHELAKIDYEICYENGQKLCFINAVQNRRDRVTDKKIERSLYKLNKGINNPNVHPNQVLPLIYFVKDLRLLGIRTIKVPTTTILDHRFHELMSTEQKRAYHDKWGELLKDKDNFNEYQKWIYERDLEFYLHVVDNADYIHYLKTEKLFMLMELLMEHDKNIELINDLDNNNGYLIYRLR